LRRTGFGFTVRALAPGGRFIPRKKVTTLMSITMSGACKPALIQMLTALSANLDKAEAHAARRKFDPAGFASYRLAPDMFTLARQVQIACDFAKGMTSRLAGREVPKWEDNEKTLGELKARIARTIDHVKSIKDAEIDGSEERDISLTVGGQPMSFKGQTYLVNFALPNFYFHVTTAYAILRHAGLAIGKRDFMGQA
jgi:hypothetical protein